MFEKAARLKIRFNTDRGQLTVEDLWQLPLTSATGRINLDDIAKGLQRDVRASAETTSFVDDAADGPSEDLQLAFDIVKHVIAVRKAERDEAKSAEKKREDKQKILALIADKQDEALKGKSLEELTAMVEAM